MQQCFRLAVLCLLLCGPSSAGAAEDKPKKTTPVAGPGAAFSQVLGRPTGKSVSLSVLSSAGGEAYAELQGSAGEAARRTPPVSLKPGVPAVIELDGLSPDTDYSYRLYTRQGAGGLAAGEKCSFRTQRATGSSFTFGVQGDSHPERAGKMFDAGLYAQALRNAAKDRPDFYLTLGDDFSIERLIEQKALSQESVDKVYAYQRGFLGLVGCSSALFLVNGNHEQAARYLLDGTPANAAVLAARARNKYFPLPAPDGFYTGDAEKVEHAGLLRDYYAWTWGDALFVVIDPYWHSPVAVDNKAGERAPREGKQGGKKGGRKGGRRGGEAAAEDRGEAGGREEGKGGGKGKRDSWQATLGEAQYRWLERTLAGSKARWKFVFAHHVNGTGRGGVESAGLFEWGGKDKRGRDMFEEKRPGWALPIHALMAKSGVSIFFQGHDHLYARQELDGVVYQSVPNPADPTYTAFNREAYRSGDVLPNSGYLRVSVGPEQVRVDYVRASVGDGEGGGNGSVAGSYTLGAAGSGK